VNPKSGTEQQRLTEPVEILGVGRSERRNNPLRCSMIDGQRKPNEPAAPPVSGACKRRPKREPLNSQLVKHPATSTVHDTPAAQMGHRDPAEKIRRGRKPIENAEHGTEQGAEETTSSLVITQRVSSLRAKMLAEKRK